MCTRSRQSHLKADPCLTVCFPPITLLNRLPFEREFLFSGCTQRHCGCRQVQGGGGLLHKSPQWAGGWRKETYFKNTGVILILFQGFLSFWRGNVVNVVRYFPTQVCQWPTWQLHIISPFRHSTLPSKTSSRQSSWEQDRMRSPPTSFGSSLERTLQAGEQREQLVSPLFTRSTLPGLGWELMLARALQRESTRWVTPTTPVRRSIPVHFNSIEMFNFKSKGLVDCIGKSFKADGVVKGLYPGFLSSVQGIIIYRWPTTKVVDLLKLLISGPSTLVPMTQRNSLQEKSQAFSSDLELPRWSSVGNYYIDPWWKVSYTEKEERMSSTDFLCAHSSPQFNYEPFIPPSHIQLFHGIRKLCARWWLLVPWRWRTPSTLSAGGSWWWAGRRRRCTR